MLSFLLRSNSLLSSYYVDDITIIGNSTCTIVSLISRLNTTFSFKDLGRLNFFIHIEVAYTKLGIQLSQQKYACDLIAKCSLQDSKHVDYRNVAALDDPNDYRNVV